MKYETKFSLGDKVTVDGDPDLKAIVTAISFRKTGVKVEISYFVDGKLEEPWIDEWRLSFA